MLDMKLSSKLKTIEEFYSRHPRQTILKTFIIPVQQDTCFIERLRNRFFYLYFRKIINK